MNYNSVASPDITTRVDLEWLIETFYSRVFADEQIGLFFSLVAHVTPQTHFPLMVDFWELALFVRNRHRAAVTEKYAELPLKHALEPHHAKRWIVLFCLTVEDLFSGPTAEAAKVRARSLATMLQAPCSPT